MRISGRPPAAALAGTVLGAALVTCAAAPAQAARDTGGTVDGVAVTYMPDGMHKAGHDVYVDNDEVGSITRTYTGDGGTAKVTVYRSAVGRSLTDLRAWTDGDMPAPHRTTVHGAPAYEGEQGAKDYGIIWIDRPGVGVNVRVTKPLGPAILHKIADGAHAIS